MCEFLKTMNRKLEKKNSFKKEKNAKIISCRTFIFYFIKKLKYYISFFGLILHIKKVFIIVFCKKLLKNIFSCILIYGELATLQKPYTTKLVIMSLANLDRNSNIYHISV